MAADPGPPVTAEVALLEDDLAFSAVIEPSEIIIPIDMPAHVVLCFFSEIIETIAGRGDATKVGELVAAHGRHPIWEIEHRNQRLGVVHPGVGAPLAAAFVEEAIALGAAAQHQSRRHQPERCGARCARRSSARAQREEPRHTLEGLS